VAKKPDPEMIRVTVDMPREMAAELEAKAEKEDRSRSAVIRQLLLRALAANEKTA
jgi:metal-responsive CopG/Arc/MetJ family transcriptional regulator